jgi:hypothetical protein
MYQRYWRFGFAIYVPLLHTVTRRATACGSIECIFNQLAAPEDGIKCAIFLA